MDGFQGSFCGGVWSDVDAVASGSAGCGGCLIDGGWVACCDPAGELMISGAGALAVVVTLEHVAANLVSAVLHEGVLVWLEADAFAGHGGTVRTFGLVLDPVG